MPNEPGTTPFAVYTFDGGTGRTITVTKFDPSQPTTCSTGRVSYCPRCKVWWEPPYQSHTCTGGQ